ncbi:MAG: EamA family transporter [Austwickia sp.]|nr:EamA family transporter [Austwickia sp.]MBK9101026.1 EamA family transporter [Austwickia sp.]
MRRSLRSSPPPVVLVLAAIVSVQFGGALAATLIPLVGVLGSVALRLALALLVMLVIARPRLRGHTRGDWLAVVLFGAALAAMNASFYGSLARLPIGVAVTIEFIGPLLLAAALSRRLADGLAVVAAAAGIVLISGIGHVPLGDLDLLGVGLALVAGACWAAYIVLSGRVGARFPRLEGLTWAMVVATVLVAPFGIAQAGTALLDGDAVLRGVGIALLSSVVPYSLELLARRRIESRVFGVLMSLEPAVAALAGFLLLHQRLTGLQLAGMSLVVAASVVVASRPAPAGDLDKGVPATA